MITVAGFFTVLLLYPCTYSQKIAKRLLAMAKITVYDVVIVQGVPLEDGKWSRTMKARIYCAKYLYDLGITKNIFFSGSAVYTPYYEGIIMSLYAIELGVSPAHVFYETEANHSTENIYYSYAKAKSLGFNKIALASHPFQTKMLRRFTREKVSSDVAMLPMVTEIFKILKSLTENPAIDLEKAYNKNFISIKKERDLLKD